MEVGGVEYIIRTVKPTDLDELLAMLIDLIKYEGSFEHFKLTRKRLEKELFDIYADWYCLVAAAPQEKLLGFCLYTFANINRAFNVSPMLQVDHLYVKPEFRNAKIGFNLMHELALVAQNKNIGRLNVWCMKSNVKGQNFYQQLGAEKRDFVDVYSIQIAKILN